MDLARLRPHHSRANSQSDDYASDSQNSDDGYDYNIVDDAPEAQPTKAKKFKSVKTPQAPIEASATTALEDADHAFTETMPYIWQRHAGGRRAKIPEVDLDLERGVGDGATMDEKQSAKAVPDVTNVQLRWTLPEIKGRRVLQLTSSMLDVGIQEHYLQRRRVRWHHSEQDVMQLDGFESLVNDCQAQGLAGGERGLTRRLLKRVRNMAEREFVGGKFLSPLALRYDNQDESRYSVDKTCIFFSFPYFLVAKPGLRKLFEKDDPRHPARTLLQSHYRLHRTDDRDRYQCISLLKSGTVATSINTSDKGRQGRSRSAIENLVFVPQLWGVIDGLDTLISSGPIDRETLRGSALDITESISRPVGYTLSLVRILFKYQNRREDLIYPVIQCDSWFGLLNKQQQILEFLGTENDKPRPKDYRFWLDDGRPITISNWSSLLRESQSTEIIDVWMKQETPRIHVQSTEGHRVTIRQPTFSMTDVDVPDNPSDVPAVSAFFAWDILDEFGYPDNVSLPDRVGKFLKAIYDRVAAETKIQVEGKCEDQVSHYLTERLQNSLALELVQNFRLLFQFYIPEGQHTPSRPIEMYWGAVYEIVETFAENPSLGPTLSKYSTMVSNIVFHAKRLHQGVYCSRAVHDPKANEWYYEDAVAKGAILLAVVVDALGAIIQMIVETVRCLRDESDEEPSDIMGPTSKVTGYGKDACEFLKGARDQLIKEADGRDKNGNIGPVVTPEAITIALLERLACGVFRNGTVDIIHLYEECLEHLTLKVKNEASRRLLQRLNGFQEEIAIVKDVLKEQDNVLSVLRVSLDPKTFRTPSITRKLRYKFEYKAIERILISLREQTKNCDELMERAKSLAIQNVQLVETFQDDNSKAIFVFTIVTVLFLPMSFVASFFGMNVIGLSATTTTLKHFWSIALPLTFGIVIPCTVVALKGEEVYFGIARMYRGLKRPWSKAD